MTRSSTALASLATLLLASCAVPEGSEDPIALYRGAEEGRLTGVVTGVDGLALPGVEVTLPTGQSAVTDAGGAYLIDGITPADGLVATFTLPGFNTAYNDTAVTAYQTRTANAILRPVHRQISFDSRVGGSFSDGAGTLTFAPDSVVDAYGQTWDGEVELDLTFVDVNTDGTDWIGPGDFRGVRASGEEGLLVSAGFFEATLRTPDGDPLNVDPDRPVGLELRVPDGLGPIATDALEAGTIPLWWFDPDTARWIEDGEATLVQTDDGPVFTGELRHFTWWNVDWWYEDLLVCVRGQVVDMAGNPVPSAEIVLVGNDWRLGAPYTVTAVADETGHFEVGEAFELQEVLITVHAVVAGQDITTTITWETGPSISQWGDECEEMPDPIVLPACILAGDVRLSERQIGGVDLGELSESSIATAGETEASAGLAQFYEPVALPSCGHAWQEVATGTCEVLAELNDLPWELPTQAAPADAGPRLRLAAGGTRIPYVREEGTWGPEYRAQLTTPPATDTLWRLTVEGSDAVPGFVESGALKTPQDLLITVPFPFLIDVDTTADLELSYTGGGRTAEHTVYAVIEPSYGLQGVVCRAADTGSVTIPASAMSSLELGDATIHVFRTDTRFTTMPSGETLRTIGSSAYSASAILR
jgi:hypothetical protein